MEISKSCEYCKTTFVTKSDRKKYCKRSCSQRAYEQRKGIAEPKFLSKYQPNTTKQKPTKFGSTLGHLAHRTKSEIEHLEERKNYLLNRFLQITEKQLRTQKAGKLMGGVVGLTLGIKLSKNTDNRLFISLASAGIFGYVGGIIGNQNGKITDKDQAKLESIKAEISTIDNKINSFKLIDTSLLKVSLKSKKELTSVTGLELSKMQFDSYTVDGRYKELLGDIERGFNLAIFGAAGSGKSSVAIDLTANLKNHGRVIYFATEEGISKSLQSKISRYKAKSPHIVFQTTNDWSAIKNKINNVEYVVFDSIERIKGITPDELNELYRSYPHVSFISILQANKDGTYKGDSKYGHDVDMIWKVKNLSVWNDKNRYGGTGMVDVNSDDRPNKVRT